VISNNYYAILNLLPCLEVFKYHHPVLRVESYLVDLIYCLDDNTVEIYIEK
jgi:hypothetical protein